MDYIFYNYDYLFPKAKDGFYHILYTCSINGLRKLTIKKHISNNGRNPIKYTLITTSINKDVFEKKTTKQKHKILDMSGLIS